MKKLLPWIAIVVLLIMLYVTYNDQNKCNKMGGIFVKNIWGFSCIKAEVLK